MKRLYLKTHRPHPRNSSTICVVDLLRKDFSTAPRIFWLRKANRSSTDLSSICLFALCFSRYKICAARYENLYAVGLVNRDSINQHLQQPFLGVHRPL